MAIHANSTPVPARPLLGPAARLGRLLSPYPPAPAKATPSRSRPGTRAVMARQSELLAILDAGPISAAEIGHLSRQRRRQAEDGIAALIALLDAIDPDCDLEDDGCAEPYCGFPQGLDQRLNLCNPTLWDECEPEADAEPDLGTPETLLTFSSFIYGPPAMFDQTWWGSSGMFDRELVNEDGGDILDEPHDAMEDCHV